MNNTQNYLKSQEGIADINKFLIKKEDLSPLSPPLHLRDGGINPFLSIAYGVEVGEGRAVGVRMVAGTIVGVEVVEGLPHNERQVASLSSTFFISTGSSG